MTDIPAVSGPSHGALFYVAAVNIVIWAGLFVYVIYLERKLHSALKQIFPEDKA